MAGAVLLTLPLAFTRIFNGWRAEGAEWAYYTGDMRGTKYRPLAGKAGRFTEAPQADRRR